MKQLVSTIFALFFTVSIFAQSSAEAEVKQTIIDFFEAFHKQDTVKLKTMSKGNINMQSISVNKDDEMLFTENDYNTFLKNIAGVPAGAFVEKLLDFKIQIDGRMANAWTPYEFWYKGKLGHCGVNSFQLVKEENDWKIIYLVDTRRKRCPS